jgi:hypothetical protein
MATGETGGIMNVQRRDFLLLVTLAAAVATPARAQTVAPAAPPATQSAASIPDFSGIWAHLTLPGFEPPASGLGPVRIKSRLPNGAANFQQAAGDYTDPNLKAQAAEVVKKYGEIELSGMPNPNPANQCWPGGVPYVFWNIGMQMLQQPHEITILYSNDHEVRRVRINQPHPAQVTPSWYGDSVGRYEGDTLVVDTVGIKVGPFAMVDFYGTPHTEALHVVERYRLVDYEVAKDAEERGARENFRVRSGTGFASNPDYKGKGLQLQFTVEDEGVFTMPWSATITYRRPLGEWPEFVCAENTQWYPGKNSAVPNADKPDF